jgi:hypothetical protein
MRGSLRHSPTTARRAESTTLAREGDEPIVSARVAVDAHESMGEHTTFEVRPDLSLHEPGDGRALLSRPSEEGLELLANDFVEKGLLGFMAFVLDGSKEPTGTMGWSALPAQASIVPKSRRRQASG